jgi:hypothetical protein
VAERRQLRPGPDGAEHEPRPAGPCHLVGDLARDPGALLGQFPDAVCDVVIGEVGQVRPERVGLHGVRAGGEVRAVDAGDDVRAGVVQDLVAPLEPGEVVEHEVAALAGVLQHGAHRAVRHDDPLLEDVEDAAVEGQRSHVGDLAGHEIEVTARASRPSPVRSSP